MDEVRFHRSGLPASVAKLCPGMLMHVSFFCTCSLHGDTNNEEPLVDKGWWIEQKGQHSAGDFVCEECAGWLGWVW